MTRELKFCEAINEAVDICMARDPAVYLMGLGVPDPKGIFGTTRGLAEKYGSSRVLDMPTAENGMTGVAIGSALVGMRPVMVHQRFDFALLAMEQLVNQAAKWHYTFAGKASVPLVVRLIVGRGWGQGPTHCQSLQALVCPCSRAQGGHADHAARRQGPAHCQHRGQQPGHLHRAPLAAQPQRPGARRPLSRAARLVPGCCAKGDDLTIAATSYMTVEALRAARRLEQAGVGVEVIDLRTVQPLDDEPILKSVRKTGRLIVADTGGKNFGIGAEMVARVVEGALSYLKAPPQRIGLPDCPGPSTPALARHYFPRVKDIVAAARHLLALEEEHVVAEPDGVPLDVPDLTFAGPF